MTKLFLEIINISFSATWLVLTVLALRFLLRKVPKWVNVLLWGLVAFRLMCPFTLESALSLIPSAEVVSPQIMTDPTPQIHTGVEYLNTTVNQAISESFTPDPAASANPLQILLPIASGIWLTGMAVMLLYSFISYLRLYHKVRMAIRVKGNIYLSEFVSSPFVLGLVKPRIYLPYHMKETDRRHVVSHERAHIYRRDHWWKPLGFLLLAIHWFNPMMWLAYILLCRDIELACDERVIKQLGTDQRADYSEALLHCSVTHRSIAACPLAFGEVGVKDRVKNILSYQKPAFWVIAACLLIVAIVSVCFLTDPKDDDDPFGATYRVREVAFSAENISLIYHPDDCPRYRLTRGMGLEILEEADTDNALTVGSLEEFSLTKENFDNMFLSSHAWNMTSCTEIRENNAKAWQVFAPPSGDFAYFYYLLLQHDGTIYIAKGNYDSTPNDNTVTLPSVSYVFKLEQDDGTPPEENKSLNLLGQTFLVTDLLYEDPRLSSTWSWFDIPCLSITQNCNLLALGTLPTVAPQEDAPWVNVGSLINVNLTEENFDDYISDRSGRKLAKQLRQDNAQAWCTNSLNETLYYLLRQENGDLYLACGYYDKEAQSNHSSDDSYIRWLLKLDIAPQTDWAVSMTNQYFTQESIILLFHQVGTIPDGSLSYGEDYYLERLNDGVWEEIPALVENRTFNTIAYVIDPESHSIISHNWAQDYGSLPAGDYRIKKSVTLNRGPGDNETRWFYSEFSIAEATDADVTLTIEELTPTGMLLRQFVNDSGNSTVSYGNFFIEVLQDGQWIYLEPTVDIEPIFKDVKRNIPTSHPAKDTDLAELDWTNLYGELPSGTYRVGNSYTFYSSTGNRLCTAYAEFTVTEDIGIDLLLDRISDNGISVSFLLDDSIGQGEYFFAGVGLQQKNRSIHWEDILPLDDTAGGFDLAAVEYPDGSLLWDEAYHTLSEGNYRVCVALRHILPDGTEEVQYLYEYFDPATYAWGVSLDVTKVSTTEHELWIEYQETYTKALPAGSISISSQLGLQKRENNQWVDIPSAVTFQSNLPDTYPIHMPGRDRGGRDLTSFFGTLQNGTYRLVRYVTRHYEDGSTETRPVYAIFAIDSLSTGHVSLGTATVEITDPTQITKNLRAEDCSGTASYLGTGNGYNFFDYMTEDLVAILNGLEKSDFQPSPGITPTTSITLESGNQSLTLLSDGETVEFDFGTEINKALGKTLCVKQDALNDFFAMINSYSPENSTYEIYNVAPLEDLPPTYTLEEAAIDNVVTFVDGDILDNASVWQEFVAETSKGRSATVRTMNYYGLPDPERYAPELYESIKDDYPKKYIHDLTYDGKTYTLRWFEEGKEIIKTYQYLRHFTGEAPSDTAIYDAYDQYLLTNNATATWEEIFFSAASSQLGAYIDHYTIYSDYIIHPKKPIFPTPVKVELTQNGEPITAVTDEARIHDLMHLLQNAEDLGFEPKTYSLGLDLILTASDRSQTTIHLVLEEDLFQFGDTFYDYGPGNDDNGGIDNRRTLFDLLGLPDFPLDT